MKDEPIDIKEKQKLPIPVKRPSKKKQKDKPKRPLSAYNFFFKEEREKILKVVLADEADKSDNDPESHDFLDEDALKRLRKEGGKVSFEEMGKIIGQRWKNIEPNRLTKFSELAAEDTERYKKEMTEYNGRQEQKMRNEALKPPVSSFTRGDKSGMASMMDPSRAGYGDAMASFGAQMGGYYGGMDFSAYGMGMGGMYAPYGYPASMGGGADGMGGSGSGMAGRMDSSQYAQGGGGMYGMMGGGYQGQMMGYGGQGDYSGQGQQHPGMDPSGQQGMYGPGGYGGQGGWGQG